MCLLRSRVVVILHVSYNDMIFFICVNGNDCVHVGTDIMEHKWQLDMNFNLFFNTKVSERSI